jgi:myo-inositol-1(or 4)-monophosphatase
MDDKQPFDEAWLEVCEAAARAGGRELQAWRGRFQTKEKGAADYVTDADLASQYAIHQMINSRFPNHAFVGEEQSDPHISAFSSELTWIVDPLDGTTNYIHGYPHYAVSVAAAQGTTLVTGCIYDPVNEHCFTAACGKGAWCNSVPLRVSNVRSASTALVAVSLPARVRRDSRDLNDFIEATQVCQAVRRSGSAALNLAHVASGALDAFWATHIHPWDVAAGVLLIREAGGLVTARDGSSFELWNPHFLAAANPQLHQEMLGILTPSATN